MDKPKMHFLQLESHSILDQLRLEEALLRADEGNWCLINHGSPPAIVMGISGKKEQLIEENQPLPVIRRFSGGGTVVVDEQTTFITFICNEECTSTPCFPGKVHCYIRDFYQEMIPGFALRENDYVIGDRKFGGNAQYMQRGRWLHHSTLLWGFEAEKMCYLKMPPKMPEYRGQRKHKDFLCTLESVLKERSLIEQHLQNKLAERFELSVVDMDQVEPIMERPHRKATELLLP